MIGKTLGHYKILDLLGAGGMGEVYRAEDTTLDREVALKVLPTELSADPDRLARFEREAKTLAALDHPNIVTIHSVEEANGVRFLTMQLVEGKPLSEMIPRGGMPLNRIFDIATPLADALATAHEKGVIHRDLKPANIMVTDEGRVKVLDFGLAKLRHEVAPTEASELPTEPLTEEGRILGTVPYMSPEHLEGKEIDSRADIFSLGVVLYEMATGERPFKGDSSVSLIMSIGRDTPLEVDAVREELPHHLGRVIGHCLEKNPKRRFQSAIDVHNELDALRKELESGVVLRSGAGLPKVGPPRGRQRWLVAAGVAVLLVVVVVLWIARPQAPTSDGRQITSLAVLPLRDFSGNPTQEYFSEGMTEELITVLSKIRALKVISRTSVMRYKETEKSLPEIAEELGVDALIEGSVLQSGTQVRITAQLIDGRTDEHLWAESYTRELEDVLALHSEVARAIVKEIRVNVTPDEKIHLISTRKVDPEALAAYVRGRYHWNNGTTADDFQTSIEDFQNAIAIDPAYAQAYGALAEAYIYQGIAGTEPPDMVFPKARATAEKALEIDDSVVQAHTALGEVSYHYDWDWENADRLFRWILETYPGYGPAHARHSGHLTALGEFDEADAEIKRAIELDPMAFNLSVGRASNLYRAKRYEEAMHQALKTVDLDSTYIPSRRQLAATYARLGRTEEALEATERAEELMGGGPSYLRARVLAILGKVGEAKQILQDLQESPTAPTLVDVRLAELYSMLGETDTALSLLEQACDARIGNLVWINVHPAFDSLRHEPRFQDLLRRMNLPT